MTDGRRTLFILPNAIGDVIAGRGVAARLAEEGPVTWIVNELAAPVLADTPHRLIHPPANRIRRMAELGAPIESVRAAAAFFLASIVDEGPWDRVVQVHLSRSAALMAGAATLKHGAGRRLGPALGESPALPEGLVSDPWSDFLLGAIATGTAPELPAAARFSLVAGLPSPALPEDSGFSRPSPAADALIVLFPSAGWPSKRLAPAQAAAIADALSELGDVLLLGGPGDRGLLDTIIAAARSKRLDAICAPLPRLLDLVLAARLVVTADSWPLHAATAGQRPVLALLGSTRVFPRGARAAALAPAEAPSWRTEGERTIDQIDPASVVSVAASLLAGLDPHAENLPEHLRCWSGPGLHPLPNRPVPLSPSAGATMLLAWARARGFEAVARGEYPGLPGLPLRPAEHVTQLIADPHAAWDEAARAMNASDEGHVATSLQLFPTSFPGRDPEIILANWKKEYERALVRLRPG